MNKMDQQLPYDVLCHIHSFLDAEECLTIRLCCRAFASLSLKHHFFGDIPVLHRDRLQYQMAYGLNWKKIRFIAEKMGLGYDHEFVPGAQDPVYFALQQYLRNNSWGFSLQDIKNVLELYILNISNFSVPPSATSHILRHNPPEEARAVLLELKRQGAVFQDCEYFTDTWMLEHLPVHYQFFDRCLFKNRRISLRHAYYLCHTNGLIDMNLDDIVYHLNLFRKICPNFEVPQKTADRLRQWPEADLTQLALENKEKQ